MREHRPSAFRARLLTFLLTSSNAGDAPDTSDKSNEVVVTPRSFATPRKSWYLFWLHLWLQVEGSEVPEQSPIYPNAPLAMVAVEVRFPEQPDGVGRRARDAIRAAVRESLPLVENITQEEIQVALGAPIPASVQRRTFPRFVTRDRTTTLVVNETTMILETTQYSGYAGFRPLIETVLDAVARTTQPDGVLRVGLRYIDEIRVPSIKNLPGDWSGYIDSHLLAAVDPAFLPSELTPRTWQGLVQYSTGPDCTLTFRIRPR